MEKAEKIYRVFDTSFQLISKVLLSAVKRLSVYAVAVLPGSIFGFTIYEFFLQLTGIPWLSAVVGFSGFIALESAGIWSGNKAAEFYGDGTNRIRVPIIAFIFYLAIGIGTLWFLDGFVPPSVQILGTSLFLLASIIYTLFGFQAHQERTDAKESKGKRDEILLEIQKENREFEREEERKDRALERRIKKELALSKPIRKEKTAVSDSGGGYDEKVMADLVAILKSERKITKTQLAKELGISRVTLYRYLDIVKANE